MKNRHYIMKRIIDKKHCREVELLSRDEKNIDKSRVSFILKKKLILAILKGA